MIVVVVVFSLQFNVGYNTRRLNILKHQQNGTKNYLLSNQHARHF